MRRKKKERKKLARKKGHTGAGGYSLLSAVSQQAFVFK